MPGFALGCFASFKPFWPLPLVQLALVAIIFQALRRFRGAVLFRSLRPSSSWGFPFWRLGLTVQSSRPAFGGRLTLAVGPFNHDLACCPPLLGFLLRFGGGSRVRFAVSPAPTFYAGSQRCWCRGSWHDHLLREGYR